MESQYRWVNNFWGPNDSGYNKLMQRMHHAKQTSEEIESYYKEWMQIERDYSKRLQSLSRKPLGTHEVGGFRQGLDSVRANTQIMSKTHDTVVRQLNEQIIAPADALFSSLRDRRKTVEDTMAQLTKAKAHENSSCEKLRSKYESECNKISGFQAQQNLLMGKELEKNNVKLDKASVQVEIYQRQYQDSLKSLASAIEIWNSEWKINCDKLEQLESERLSATKSNLWAFTNALSAACVTDDEACEAIRQSLEKCDPNQDLEMVSKKLGTGSEIQDPPEFVNFLQGFSRDTQGKSNSHVAKFDSALDLKDNNIPDLSVHNENMSSMMSSGSPRGSIRDSPNRSPEMESAWQYSPDSAMSSPEMEEKPKKRSWAMPFHRQTSPDMSFQSQDSIPSPITKSNDTSVNGLRIQNAQQQAAPVQKSKLDNRKSWAPASSNSSRPNNTAGGDPLLQALESLKAPSLKPRPHSTYASMNNNGNTGSNTASPYGNGSPVASSPSHSPVPKQKVVRKQVGGDANVPTSAPAIPAVPALPKMSTDGFPVLKHCRAMYDYRAAIPEEVSFRKGDILLITELQEDGWWDCEVHGKQAYGLAPSNFLQEI